MMNLTVFINEDIASIKVSDGLGLSHSTDHLIFRNVGK